MRVCGQRRLVPALSVKGEVFMSAAKATAAQRGLRRRSAVTFLAAIAAASLTLGSGSVAVVLGADNNGNETPPTPPAKPPKTGSGQSDSQPSASPSTTPSAAPAPTAAPSAKPTPSPKPSASAKPSAPPPTDAPTGPVWKPDPDPKDPAAGTLTPDQQRAENVIAAARQYVGIPYLVGSEGPNVFDCSGLVFRAFSDTGLVNRIGGARLRAAGYMRWFASRGMMTRDESQAQRGDLVIYHDGSHIGIYLGDGRVISALVNPWGVTVHALHGVSLPVTGFLRPDWSGEGMVAPFVPVDLPDVPEAPVSLIAAADWMPTLDPTIVAPQVREGKERVDLRTTNSRTFENADGTFTTEFHAQPIYSQPAATPKP